MSRNVKYAPVKTFNPGLGEFLAGLFVGWLFLGALTWTHLGRELVKEAIARGAGVAREKVEEWLRRGERRE